MTKTALLEALCGFTRDVLQDLRLPVQMQEEDETPPRPRPPEVHVMGLRDFRSVEAKAPYLFHQLITAKDRLPQGQWPGESTAVVRTVAAVYHPDNREGQLALLGIFERQRLALLRQGWLADQFQLDTEAGIEYLIYPDNIPPFYAGEMVTTWKLPPVEREIQY